MTAPGNTSSGADLRLIMQLDKPTKPILIQPTRPLYKWANIFNRLQRRFFVEDVQLRREKQIQDFVRLNGFCRVAVIKDTDVLQSLQTLECPVDQAQLTVITDQKFSRYPCPVIVTKIKDTLLQCPRLYLCLNRHYINIDNSWHDPDLDANFNVAIGQWLRKNLVDCTVLDLSLDFVDRGRSFTWAVPDRHFYITNDKNHRIL